MPVRNSEKNKEVIKELEKTISPILVVNNSSLKPYVELFDYSPENIYQHPLGSLVGFFEIKEYSQDSAYVVNFLTSVLKKEYYINPKRSVADSFDAALHKVNLALSELAKQGNVEWIGNIHAAICVIEKNNAHFTTSGNAKLFLYRTQTLTDISEGLASEVPDPHPLKTFVNVSSGRLEKNDGLLITSEDIFHILNENDLKKNFQRFEGEKLVQFLKTALSNQLEMIASVLVQIYEPAVVVKAKTTSNRKTSSTANVFSEKTFAGKTTSNKNAEIENEKFSEQEAEEEPVEYTDKKTGHIYVQGEAQDEVGMTKSQLYWELSKEKIGDYWYRTKNITRRRISLYKKQLAKKHEERKALKEEKSILAEQEAERLRELEIINQIEREQQIESQRFMQETQRQIEQEQPSEAIGHSEHAEEKISYSEKLEPFSVETVGFVQKASAFSKTILRKALLLSQSMIRACAGMVKSLIDKIKSGEKSESRSSVIPHFSKIKKLYSSFSYQQKLYTLLALAIIFIVPIFINRWINRPKTPTISSLQTITPSPSETLAMDKNINLSAQQKSVLNRSDLVTTLISNAGPVAVTKTSLVVISDAGQKESPLPAGSGNAVRATFMHDLSLVFIFTDQNKITSFSPTTGKFADNNIDLGGSTAKSFIGTYLTYLYVINPENNQINRYPRADGGFGAKTSWLKDTTSLSSISDMTIDDNIYAVENNKVLKFFKGKSVDFKLEDSNTPVQISSIYTTPDLQSIYVLDAKNRRVVQYTKDGTITAQFFNESLRDSTSLAIDEASKTAYVANSTGLISVSLQ